MHNECGHIDCSGHALIRIDTNGPVDREIRKDQDASRFHLRVSMSNLLYKVANEDHTQQSVWDIAGD